MSSGAERLEVEQWGKPLERHLGILKLELIDTSTWTNVQTIWPLTTMKDDLKHSGRVTRIYLG